MAWSRTVASVFGFLPQTLRLGARNLFRRRTRAVLTLSALALSGAAFLAVQTTSASFNNVLDQVFANYHADVWAQLNNPQPQDQVQPLVTALPGVGQVDPGTFSLVQTKWGQAEIVGLPPDSRVYRKNVLQGRWFTPNDQNAVLLNEAVADKTGLKVGDSISFHNDLYTGRWNVIGVARDYNNPLGLGVMLAPLSQVNAFQHLPSTFVQAMLITSTSSKQSDIDNLSKRVDDALARAGLQASVATTAAQVSRNQSSFLVIYALFYSVVAIIALVGAIGLFNALAMGVLERRREIGILRSMGATGGKVAQVFLAEGIGLGVVGWLVAIVIGIPLAFGFIAFIGQVLLRVPFAFDPRSILVMLVFIVVIAALASLSPVWAASRVKISQTLRYE
jgi:putative ABC transport system permease protein